MTSASVSTTGAGDDEVRVFRCYGCHGICVRPVQGDPKPCDCCDTNLKESIYVVMTNAECHKRMVSGRWEVL